MKKQTAVEFAVEKLDKLIPSGNQIVIGIILEQANQLFREQIIDAHNNGHNYYDFNGINAEQYYSQTFNK